MQKYQVPNSRIHVLRHAARQKIKCSESQPTIVLCPEDSLTSDNGNDTGSNNSRHDQEGGCNNSRHDLEGGTVLLLKRDVSWRNDS